MDWTWLIPAEQWGAHALVALAAIGITALVVVMHYEGMHALARRYSGRTPMRSRSAMLRIMFALLGLHIVEIWCYGVVFWLLLMVPGAGAVVGEHGVDNLFDAIYLSATTYTTLGFDDLAPIGAIRLVAGLESLAGFLLVTWSASFTYLEMSRYWRRDA